MAMIHLCFPRTMDDKETIEEFIARGGEIEQVPFGKKKYKEDWEPWEKPDGGLSFKVLQNIRKNRRKMRRLSTK